MSGAAMLAEVRADPALQSTPVVMMSAMSEAGVAERCSGYTASMPKPFRIGQVTALTKRLLGAGGEPCG